MLTEAGSAAGYEPVLECRLCGATRATMTTVLAGVPNLERPQDRFTLLQCGTCGLTATDPYPDETTLAGLYAGGDSSDYEFPAPGIVGRIKDRLAAHRLRTLAREAAIVPRRVLDFGTGAGRYAAAARVAFPAASVTGTDFGEAPPAGSYFELDGALQYAGYESLRGSGASFDFILARHVLEHVHDPVGMLRDWLSLLEPAGVLYVEVPNQASRIARFAGARWPLWYVPKHLSHFARPALRRVIDAAGGSARLGTCEMPLMGNIAAIVTGHSRFDSRFRIPGIVLHPLQIGIEKLAREGTCLYAIVKHRC